MMRKVSDDVEEVKGDVNALNADDVLKSYICNTGNGGQSESSSTTFRGDAWKIVPYEV